jgi:hypothetical protein
MRGRQVSGMAAAQQVAGSSVLRLLEEAKLAAGHAGGSNPATGKIAVVVIAVAAVSVFTVLQLMARSRRQRSPRPPEAWTFAPRQEDEPWDNGRTGDDDALFEEQGSYGPSPGYSASPRPPWNWLRIMRSWKQLAY